MSKIERQAVGNALKATRTPSTSRNKEGQAMGLKGRATRERLIRVTGSLLETQPMDQIRVADIARLAETSPPTFYLYFRGVADAALAAIDAHTQSTPELLQMIAADWTGDGQKQARAFVETYFTVWNSQAAIFRARNLAAEAGLPGFYAARERAVRPLMQALSARIARQQAFRHLPAALHPASTASVVIALLERLAAIAGAHFEDEGITQESITTSASYFVALAMQGHMPVICMQSGG
jgi:AcrR family transcriptional regulator